MVTETHIQRAWDVAGTTAAKTNIMTDNPTSPNCESRPRLQAVVQVHHHHRSIGGSCSIAPERGLESELLLLLLLLLLVL
jgi:hypothetical protein